MAKKKTAKKKATKKAVPQLNRGGRRPGAGRKQKYGTETAVMPVRAPLPLIAAIEAYAKHSGMDRSSAVVELLSRAPQLADFHSSSGRGRGRPATSGDK